MKNRQPKNPGRVRLTPVPGHDDLFDMTMADGAEIQGDPLSKETLLQDETCRRYGFDNTAVPDDVFRAIGAHVVPKLAVVVPEGTSITVTNGTMVLTNSDADEYNGTWIFYVQPGTWTVQVTKGVVSMSSTVFVSEVRTYTVKLLFEKIYGAEWDGTESPVWSRTDLAANFVNPSPAVSNGTGSSPFDELYPWSGMQLSTDEFGNEVVSIPKFWYKWTRTGTKMKLQIADYPAEGFYVSPAHSDRGDGSGERDVVYVGRYHCNTSGKSVTNVLPEVYVAANTGENKIRAISKEYFLIDYQTYWTICMLYLVEFADWRSQLKIGYGCSPADGTAELYLTGQTDQMQYHTGTTAESRTTYGPTQYRHIEDLWGNVYDWIGNVSPYYTNYGPDALVSFSKTPHYNSTVHATIKSVSTAAGYIRSWTSNLETPGLEFAIYPNQKVSNNSYVRDYFEVVGWGTQWYGRLIFGGSYFRNYQSGLFCLKCTRVETYNNVGYRLIRLPGYSS